MGDTLTRRSLLRASPALLAPAALASCATEVLSAPADPHPALWAEWQRIRDLYNTTTMDEAEEKRVWAHYEHLADLLRTTPATTPEGLRAQFEFMAEDLVEQGRCCALSPTWAAPFLDVFRVGLARLG